MGDSLKKEKVKQWLTTLRKVFHFIATVLMYSICLIMIIVFLVFVVNFIDKQYNLKSGNNKKDSFQKLKDEVAEKSLRKQNMELDEYFKRRGN